ncbi:MAG TPA: hypothetical protein VH703_05150 [Solirubrobacterales bacterium]|jgi:hypothetical protein
MSIVLDPEETMAAAGEFFLERAEKEYEAAEKKREAAMTKATALAALAAALAAIVAAPAFDASGLGHGATRWVLLATIVAFLVAIACIARAILIHVSPGERVSRRELDNWTSEQFWLTHTVTHTFDLTKGFIEATKGIRTANERAETWITRATASIAAGLVLLLVAFIVETL